MHEETAAISKNMAIKELAKNGQVGSSQEVEVEIVPPQTVTVAINPELGAQIDIITISQIASVDNKVRVIWDGKEYICTATVDHYWGNLGLVGGEDTGEPFLFGGAIDNSDISLGGYLIAGEGNHSICAYEIKDSITPMSIKFMPKIELSTEIPYGVTNAVAFTQEETRQILAAYRKRMSIMISGLLEETKSSSVTDFCGMFSVKHYSDTVGSLSMSCIDLVSSERGMAFNILIDVNGETATGCYVISYIALDPYIA